ncbi:transposase [Pirellulales bacterium]|nr:transposase [Pirellulales bacterium]
MAKLAIGAGHRRARYGRPLASDGIFPQQIVNAFPYDERPRFLIRDRDCIYGDHFSERVGDMGIDEVLIAPRSPWQNPYCERIIGSVRRECLDRVIVLGEAHLQRILTDHFEYYHHSRPHLSLDRNSRAPHEVETPSLGEVIAIPKVSGLHHRYTRAACSVGCQLVC